MVCCGYAQRTDEDPFSVDINYFYGTLLTHNKNIAHLVTAHPQGGIISYNRVTTGTKRWHREYNFPDWGLSFLYQDFNNPELGENYGLYAHYNFYFLNRKLQMRIAQGLAYNTNPFDFRTNPKNISYGSHMLFSTYVRLNYNQPNIIEGLGVLGGVTLVHHSNGSFKTPNSGSNVFSLNIGLSYSFQDRPNEMSVSSAAETDEKITESVKYNIVLRGGVNESDFFNLGQHPFFIFSVFADKRLSYKHTLQVGADVFFSTFLKKEIEYVALSFNSSGLSGDEDYKRVGVFLGHEFRLGKIGLVTQGGYYVYWPYEFESRVYSRAGIKYYMTDSLFGVATVKSHAFNAEAMEFGFGIRL